MNKLVTYLSLIIKNSVLLICLGLDVIGMLITYYGNIELPSYLFTAILLIGFIVANYRIYLENSQK
ncbi:MAG: hypothetical protein JM58_03180 [Peptococcaceae bacterium BICA1-8]|nr:MAG: hypothetical protein JM58_03180 [Peptococcaceae bacterium BICA1-8]